jgi:hypothetical protein
MTDTTPTNAQWLAAQLLERRFHVDEVPEWGEYADPIIRRYQERLMRYWYAALLEMPATRDISVTDYGCGPQSLLLETPGDAPAIAVDPLRFTDEDERAYQRHRIHRAYVTAETYDGPQTDEGWMYNCLQHTTDWHRALTNALAKTARTFRLYEWVNVPIDALHLHTLRTDALAKICLAAGFRETKATHGVFGRATPATFYASIWQRIEHP